MNRILTAAAAAMASAPLLITQTLHAEEGKPAPEPIAHAASHTVSQGCTFYTNVRNRDVEMHYNGADIKASPSDILKAAAWTILMHGHNSIQEDGNPSNDATSKVDKDASTWTLGTVSVTMPPLPDNPEDINVQCTYLQGVAEQVSTLSGVSVPVLFRHASAGAVHTARKDVDPHTTVIIGSDAKRMKQSTDGHFGGIGIELKKEHAEPVIVLNVLTGNPAEKAGLLKDDKITAVNGQNVADMTSDQFVELTRGKVGEPVTVTIQRGDTAPFDLTITRAVVVPEVTKVTLIQDSDTVYAKFDTFNEQTIPQFIKGVARAATKAHENAVRDNDLRKTLRIILPDYTNDGGGLFETSKTLNDLWITNEGDGCLRIVASGKNKDENVTCADTRGLEIFMELDKLVQGLILINPDKEAFTSSVILHGPGKALSMDRHVKIGKVNEHGKLDLKSEDFRGLDKANLYDVLVRLAVAEAKDKEGKLIISEDVIGGMVQRAMAESKASATSGFHMPGLNIRAALPNGTVETVLTIPLAGQNGGSASASEITGGNLVDQGVRMFGRDSHGKSSVQTTVPLDENGEYTEDESKVVAIQKETTDGFFSGKSGLANLHFGIPASTIVTQGGFRDKAEGAHEKEMAGLFPAEMSRKPIPNPENCTLKPAFQASLGDDALDPPDAESKILTEEEVKHLSAPELRKLIPPALVAKVGRINPATKKVENINMVNGTLACMLGDLDRLRQGKGPGDPYENLFITIEPDAVEKAETTVPLQDGNEPVLEPRI